MPTQPANMRLGGKLLNSCLYDDEKLFYRFELLKHITTVFAIMNCTA